MQHMLLICLIQKKKKNQSKFVIIFSFLPTGQIIWGLCLIPLSSPPLKNNGRWFPSVCHLLLALKYTCAINFNCVIKLFIHRLKQLCTDVHWWCHNASRRNFNSHLNHPSFHKKIWTTWQCAITKPTLLTYLFRPMANLLQWFGTDNQIFQKKMHISSQITMENLNEEVSSWSFPQLLFKLCPEVGGLVPVLC